MLKLAKSIDSLNQRIGDTLRWLTLAMVLIGSFNALMRYADKTLGVQLSSNAYIETQWYLFSILFLGTMAYTLKNGAHVRVDVWYGKRSEKTHAWINLAGTVLFLIPFCGLVLWASARALTTGAWTLDEMSPDPGGLPRFPIRMTIPIAFVLLALQALPIIIRSIATIRGEREVTA